MKAFFRFFSLIGCIFTLFFSTTACSKQLDYTQYLSENRQNIFIAERENFHLKIYAVDKEYPYCTDGFVGEVTSRVEVYFSIKNGGKTCHISLFHGDATLGGEMSYDSVEGEYFFSCAADLKNETALAVKLTHGEDEFTLTANSVKDESVLSPKQIIEALQTASYETFSALTKGKNFEGEIYMRLIYESAPYYYVGITGRNKKTTAFLLDAAEGKILAIKHN